MAGRHRDGTNGTPEVKPTKRKKGKHLQTILVDPGWWLNQPISKICSSQWDDLPIK